MTQELPTMSRRQAVDFCRHASWSCDVTDAISGKKLEFLDLSGVPREELYEIKGILSVGDESLQLPWGTEGEEAHENDSGVEPEATGPEYGTEAISVDPAVTRHDQMHNPPYNSREYTPARQYPPIVPPCGPTGFYLVTRPRFVTPEALAAHANRRRDFPDVYGIPYDYNGLGTREYESETSQHDDPPSVSAVGNLMDPYGVQVPPPQPVRMMVPTHHGQHILPYPLQGPYCAPPPGSTVYMFPEIICAPRDLSYPLPQHYPAPPPFTYISGHPSVVGPDDTGQTVDEQGNIRDLRERGLVGEEYVEYEDRSYGSEDSYEPECGSPQDDFERQQTPSWSDEVQDWEESKEEVFEDNETEKVGEDYEAEIVGEDYEAEIVGEDYEAEIVGEDYEAEIVGEDCEAEIVGEDCEAEKVGEDCEAEKVGEGYEAEKVGEGYETEDVEEEEPVEVEEIQEQEKTEEFPVEIYPGTQETGEAPKYQSWASLFEEKPTAGIVESTASRTPVAVTATSWQNGGSPPSPPTQSVVEQGPRSGRPAGNIGNRNQSYRDQQTAMWDREDLSRMKESLRRLDLDHRTVYITPRGLVNKGNWCYINAILQALVICPPFYNFFKKLSWLAELKKDRDTLPILRSMVKFVSEFLPLPITSTGIRHNPRDPARAEQMKKYELPQGQPFEPGYVYNVLGSVKTDSFKGRQEDAEEFLGWLLNGLHEEMLKAVAPSDAEDSSVNGTGSIANGDFNGSQQEPEEEWKEIGRRNKGIITRSAKSADSPISTIFGGVMISSFSEPGMPSCANKEPFFALPLDIQSENVTSVKEAFEGFVSRETIYGYTSSKTKEEVAAYRRVNLVTVPPVLILHLKRFVYEKDGGCQKLNKRIEFPVDLELGREIFAPRVRLSTNERKFKLFAVVYHSGKETAKGHYVTDVYHSGTGGWLRTDDSCVSPVPLEQVLRYAPPRVPYLLFYRRFDTIYPVNASYGGK